jgi:hypothetical protein
MDWMDRFDMKDTMKGQRSAVRKVIEDKDNNWYQRILSMSTDVDSGVRKAFFNNFILNENFIGFPIQGKNQEVCYATFRGDSDGPHIACNLKCIRCGR